MLTAMPQTVNDFAKVLPDKVDRWNRVEPPETYSPQTLSNYIDGGAELYISYNFKGSLDVKYRDAAENEIAVDIFDMGSSFDAFGVFAWSNAGSLAGMLAYAFLVEPNLTLGAGAAAWRWVEIAAGQPRVVAATQEAFVPQMVTTWAAIREAQQVRGHKVRGEYADLARPIVRQYVAVAKETQFKGTYQVERLNQLIAMEKTNGWATVVDEGSQDAFVQSVIDGARRTISSG